MKKSEINFFVELDEQNVPEKICWNATDNDSGTPKDTKAVALAIWDHVNKNSLRIDLWQKDMPVNEMKHFFIDCLGGMAQGIFNSTGDKYMSSELEALCKKLIKHIKTEQNQ